jgi:transcriptional regulator with XRE-family HTH domain
MPTRETRRDRADRATRAVLVDLGMEARDARIGAGISLATVGAVCGLSPSEVSRLERALIANASIRALNRIAHDSGHQISVKLYPGDDPIRDVAHARLIERVRQRIDPRFHSQTEAPLPGKSTLRGWDAMLTLDAERTAIEARRGSGTVRRWTGASG